MFVGIVLRVESSFWLDQLSTQVPSPDLQKVLSCRHSCHAWDLGYGTSCSKQLRLHILNSSDLGLGTILYTAWGRPEHRPD